MSRVYCKEGGQVTLTVSMPKTQTTLYGALVDGEGLYTVASWGKTAHNADFSSPIATKQRPMRTSPKLQTYSYCFEDAFPEAGDYDYNDIVMRIALERSDEKVMTVHVTLAAVGTLNFQAGAIRLVGYRYQDIDSIVDDEDVKKKSNRLRTTFTNSIFKDFGLPSLPTDTTDGLSAVVDQEGNPAEGFMQKATAWMQKRFPKLFAEESTNPMTKKVLACLCALLAVQDFEVTDGKITLTEEDADKIEGQLDQLGKDLQTAKDAEKAAKDAQTDLQTKLDQALQDVRDRDQQIANLKQAAGAEDEGSAAESGKGVQDINSAAELFNSVNVD